MSQKPNVKRITVFAYLPHLKKFGWEPHRQMAYDCDFPVSIGDVVRCPPTPKYNHHFYGLVVDLVSNYDGPAKFVSKPSEI